MTDFYITLVSNAQLGSTISNFKTNLPATLNFNRQYEVALSSIIYPTSHDLITKTLEPSGNYENEFSVVFGEKGERLELNCTLPNCTFSTPDELVDILNFSLTREMFKETNATQTDVKLFSYNHMFKRVNVNKIDNLSRVELSNRLSYFLGLDKVYTQFPSTGEYSFFSGSDLMYIYSDGLVEPQTISHMKVPLLKVITLPTTNVGNVEKTFTNPLYVPVRTKTVDQISIQIKDDRDHFIPFNSGKIVIVLHFRPVVFSFDG